MNGSVKESPLIRLQHLGQSIWLDYIHRGMIRSGELRRLIEEDGVSGMTSNPTICEKAIAGSHDYDDDIARLVRDRLPAVGVYEQLAAEDIRGAADALRPVYDRTDGRDGYVSFEVSPHLARDSAGSVAEARRLWKEVDRPNLFIKIPGTAEGVPAIRQCISEGMNINVTLLFGLHRYMEVTQAYMQGLEDFIAGGGRPERVASVASFFLSRIDVLLDPVLEKLASSGGAEADMARALVGQAAIASAKVAYQLWQEVFGGPRFAQLAKRGARTQRLLWASTGTKNPAYKDTMYIEPLIGPETINTLPMETLAAYRDHGDPAARVTEGLEVAYRTLARLSAVGITLDEATRRLEEEGIEKFNKPFDSLLALLRQKGAA
jgi:transaldolase